MLLFGPPLVNQGPDSPAGAKSCGARRATRLGRSAGRGVGRKPLKYRRRFLLFWGEDVIEGQRVPWFLCSPMYCDLLHVNAATVQLHYFRKAFFDPVSLFHVRAFFSPADLEGPAERRWRDPRSGTCSPFHPPLPNAGAHGTIRSFSFLAAFLLQRPSKAIRVRTGLDDVGLIG
jgi:hypothetical protein